jgi:hypothetical protein
MDRDEYNLSNEQHAEAGKVTDSHGASAKLLPRRSQDETSLRAGSPWIKWAPWKI